MSPRDTGTGAVLEAMVLPALRHSGYVYRTQVRIGERLGGGRHVVDVVAEDKDGGVILISLKWQQVSGTAEQKVPFEAICLAEAVLSGAGSRAYLVLGGSGWKLRQFYVDGGLDRHLNLGDRVRIVSLEDFIGKANRGLL